MTYHQWFVYLFSLFLGAFEEAKAVLFPPSSCIPGWVTTYRMLYMRLNLFRYSFHHAIAKRRSRSIVLVVAVLQAVLFHRKIKNFKLLELYTPSLSSYSYISVVFLLSCKVASSGVNHGFSTIYYNS